MVYYFFFVPLGTDVRRQRLPLVTWGLIAANLLVYVAAHWIGPLRPQVWRLALVPAAPQVIHLLTACFLHVGLFHLAGNMLYLALFGMALEDRLGRWRFLAIYLLGGAGALALQAAVVVWLTPAYAGWPIVGASGAVAALLGAFMVRLPHARVRVAAITMLLLHGYHRAQIRSINSVVAISVWMLLQLVYGLVAVGAPSGVAYWAHLGGLALGIALALAIDGRAAAAAERHLWRGDRHLERGAWWPAAGAFEEYLRARPDDAGGHRRLARALIAAGARRPAVDAFHRALVLELGANRLEAAAATYCEMDRLLPGEVLDRERQVAVARALLFAGEYEMAVRALEDHARVAPGTVEAELARLLVAEIRGGLLGERAVAARLWRELDARLLPARWRRHVARRRQETAGSPGQAA
ncbi:MAG: rhomboid family intramembrane serine protease [Candidatus Eiseniibacteriota bacterium]|jgi:membrane associated rhomboid family serine protease